MKKTLAFALAASASPAIGALQFIGFSAPDCCICEQAPAEFRT